MKNTLPRPVSSCFSGQPASIEVQIAEPFVARIDRARLIEAVTAALTHQDRSDSELTLVIADDKMLQQLNRSYAGIDSPTDVLAFSAQEQPSVVGPDFVGGPEAETYLGDVIISFPTAARQAATMGEHVDDELCLLAVHGVLHLLGYDHATAADQVAMWAVQQEVLASLGIHISADRAP